MEKVLLKRKTVLEGGIIIEKVYYTKNIVNSKENSKFGLSIGWNMVSDGVCSPACPPPTVEGYYQCLGGNCIFVPIG